MHSSPPRGRPGCRCGLPLRVRYRGPWGADLTNRRTEMFSPILALNARRCPRNCAPFDDRQAAREECYERVAKGRSWKVQRECMGNSSRRATKSVSQLTSTEHGAGCGCARPRRCHQAATRAAILSALGESGLRIQFGSASRSPIGLDQRPFALHHAAPVSLAEV